MSKLTKPGGPYVRLLLPFERRIQVSDAMSPYGEIFVHGFDEDDSYWLGLAMKDPDGDPEFILRLLAHLLAQSYDPPLAFRQQDDVPYIQPPGE